MLRKCKHFLHHSSRPSFSVKRHEHHVI
jgi:hypothetical protein